MHECTCSPSVSFSIELLIHKFFSYTICRCVWGFSVWRNTFSDRILFSSVVQVLRATTGHRRHRHLLEFGECIYNAFSCTVRPMFSRITMFFPAFAVALLSMLCPFARLPRPTAHTITIMTGSALHLQVSFHDFLVHHLHLPRVSPAPTGQSLSTCCSVSHRMSQSLVYVRLSIQRPSVTPCTTIISCVP